MRTRFLTAVLAQLAACGDNRVPDIDVDAPSPPGPCWPDDGQNPKGSAMLGTGIDMFEAMPDPLRIEYGSQDGFDLIANVKMSGLVPGNPDDVFDRTNPRTRIRAFFADTDVPLNFFSHCPYRTGYVPSPGGGFELPTGVAIVFEVCWRAQHLIGKQVRIDLELVDHNGDYAHNSVTVTLAEPTGFYPKDEPPMPGCVHPPGTLFDERPSYLD